MSGHKFTFLLPAYKARYLEDALRSVLNQTYTDFCVIVSDDASPEPLGEIVHRFKDDRVTYRRNDVNLGATNLAAHWNLLLDSCDSEFVIVASDDDLYAPVFLERVHSLIQRYPDVDLYRVTANIIDDKQTKVKEESGKDGLFSTEDFVHHLLDPYSVLCIGNYVFRTSALRKIGGFVSFPLAWKSDSATLLALSGNNIAETDEVLFSFRMSGLNISSHIWKNADNDRKKISATIDFHSWLDKNVNLSINPDLDSIIKNRLEGELRSYYWALSFKDFCRLYEQLAKEKWFLSCRNRLSFILGWIRCRFKQ